MQRDGLRRGLPVVLEKGSWKRDPGRGILGKGCWKRDPGKGSPWEDGSQNVHSQLIPQQRGLPALRYQIHQKHISNLTFSQIQVLSPSLSFQISCAKYSWPNSNPEP